MAQAAAQEVGQGQAKEVDPEVEAAVAVALVLTARALAMEMDPEVARARAVAQGVVPALAMEVVRGEGVGQRVREVDPEAEAAQERAAWR